MSSEDFGKFEVGLFPHVHAHPRRSSPSAEVWAVKTGIDRTHGLSYTDSCARCYPLLSSLCKTCSRVARCAWTSLSSTRCSRCVSFRVSSSLCPWISNRQSIRIDGSTRSRKPGCSSRRIGPNDHGKEHRRLRVSINCRPMIQSATSARAIHARTARPATIDTRAPSSSRRAHHARSC